VGDQAIYDDPSGRLGGDGEEATNDEDGGPPTAGRRDPSAARSSGDRPMDIEMVLNAGSASLSEVK
jgi:hypothetical protein